MRLFGFAILLILRSCNYASYEKTQVELRDSLVKEYLRILDSTRWVDSLHPQHKLLIAYNSNDTLSLKKAIVTLRAEINESVKYPSPTSCYTPPSIASYGFDEAYRFQYSAAFCDQSANVTIGIKNDSIFIYGYHYTHNYMTDSCVSVDSLKNVLTIGQWEKVRYSMERADIWGLKATNGIRGMDGSGLSVIGYQKPINAFEGRYNRVSRWAAEKSALGESFKLVLDLSGIKAKCFHY